MNPPRLIEVFHEYNFVVSLVVDQIIDKRAGHEQPKAARPQPFLLSHLHVSVRLVRLVSNGSVRKLVRGEARPWIGYPVKDHALCSQARDPHASIWIQLTAPLHGVYQKLAKRLSDRIANIGR